MSVGAWATLILMASLFGGSFFFTAVAVREIPPLTIALIRLLIAAPLLHLALRASGGRPPPRRFWGAYLLLGLINSALPISLIAWGQMRIDGGLASILAATSPLFGMVIAHFATTDERLTANRLAGVLIGFTGLVVTIGPAALASLGDQTTAQFAVLGAAFSSACGGVFGRRFAAAGIAPLASAAMQVTAAALVLTPLVILVDHPWTLEPPSAAAMLSLLTMAVFSTALAYLLFFRLLARVGATNLLLGGLLVPVSAIVLGALVLGERLSPQNFAGMALIAAGLAVIDGRLLRRLRG